MYALAAQSNSRILMGGAFTSVNSVYLNNYIARLMTDGTQDTSFNPGPGADNAVNAVAETFINGMREIYVGGAFSHINNWSIASPAIARFNDDGTLDTSFSPGFGADGNVYAIAVYPTNSIYAGKVLIGGAFTHYNGTNLNYIARLNADGSVDTTFNPGSAANGDCKCHRHPIGWPRARRRQLLPIQWRAYESHRPVECRWIAGCRLYGRHRHGCQ